MGFNHKCFPYSKKKKGFILDVLNDAKLNAKHAQREPSLDINVKDLSLALRNRWNPSHAQPPPRDVLLENTNFVNTQRLPQYNGNIFPNENTLLEPNLQLDTTRSQTSKKKTQQPTKPTPMATTTSKTALNEPITQTPKITSKTQDLSAFPTTIAPASSTTLPSSLTTISFNFESAPPTANVGVPQIVLVDNSNERQEEQEEDMPLFKTSQTSSNKISINIPLQKS